MKLWKFTNCFLMLVTRKRNESYLLLFFLMLVTRKRNLSCFFWFLIIIIFSIIINVNQKDCWKFYFQAKKAFRSAAAGDYKKVAKELRALVPSTELIRERMRGTVEILNKNLAENSLSYKIQQTLNFFLLQGRLNVRAGPILTLTWEDFQWIEDNDAPLQTDKHKTGSHYTVHIQIEKDQRQFLKLQKEAFVREVGEQPKFIFASHKNKEERSICRYLREVIFWYYSWISLNIFEQFFGKHLFKYWGALTKNLNFSPRAKKIILEFILVVLQVFFTLFNDDPSVVRYNANSIRKYWERRWKVIGKDTEDGVMKAHYAQTAHSAKTAEDHYIGREGTESDRACLLSMYAKDLASGPNHEEPVFEEPEEASDSGKFSFIECFIKNWKKLSSIHDPLVNLIRKKSWYLSRSPYEGKKCRGIMI